MRGTPSSSGAAKRPSRGPRGGRGRCAPSGAHATFLLTDPATTSNIPVPTAFGTPVAQAAFGNVHVYVYNHDVAAALSPGG